MIWKIKRAVFGIDFELDIDTSLPLKEIYHLILRFKWTGNEYADERLSEKFIIEALKFLPNDYFIIFYFDTSMELFAQFAKVGGNTFIEIPIWRENCYFGKEKELISILDSMKLTRADWKKKPQMLKPKIYLYNNQGKDKKMSELILGETLKEPQKQPC